MKQVLKVTAEVTSDRGSSAVDVSINITGAAPDFKLGDCATSADLSSYRLRQISCRVVSSGRGGSEVDVRIGRSPDASGDSVRSGIQQLVQAIVGSNVELYKDFPEISSKYTVCEELPSET